MTAGILTHRVWNPKYPNVRIFIHYTVDPLSYRIVLERMIQDRFVETGTWPEEGWHPGVLTAQSDVEYADMIHKGGGDSIKSDLFMALNDIREDLESL